MAIAGKRRSPTISKKKRPTDSKPMLAPLLTQIAFYLFSAALLAMASGVILARNPVHSVLFLIMAFFNAACLFILMGAEFLAMILLIVYIGAVAVLFLFVVMMLDIDFVALREGFWNYLPIGLALGVVLASELILLAALPTVAPAPAPPPPEILQPNIERLGEVLYTRYAHFFQMAGIILLIAMVGAIVLTLRPREGIRRQDAARQVSRKREDSVEIRKVQSGEGL